MTLNLKLDEDVNILFHEFLYEILKLRDNIHPIIEVNKLLISSEHRKYYEYFLNLLHFKYKACFILNKNKTVFGYFDFSKIKNIAKENLLFNRDIEKFFVTYIYDNTNCLSYTSINDILAMPLFKNSKKLKETLIKYNLIKKAEEEKFLHSEITEYANLIYLS